MENLKKMKKYYQILILFWTKKETKKTQMVAEMEAERVKKRRKKKKFQLKIEVQVKEMTIFPLDMMKVISN